MSLTNDQITAQNFKDFYTQIKPFLGGMPEILANKFNRSDLYSTDEKIIGQWIDGKPLYQKVFTLNSTMTVSNSSWSETNISIVDNKIDCIVSCIGYPSTNNACYSLWASSDADAFTNVAIQTPRNNSSDSVYRLLLKYTKTTDSAVVIGSDTDYSTTEKIVGTWIDGKPIYQKTIDCGVMPNTNEKAIIHGISNLDKVVSFIGFCYNTSGSFRLRPLPLVTPHDNNQLCISNVDSTSIYIETLTDFSSMSGYVTLQYTKTTD